MLREGILGKIIMVTAETGFSVTVVDPEPGMTIQRIAGARDANLDS